MLQSILALLALVAVLVFYIDIRRRMRSHSMAVQRERDAIAEQSHFTAVMSNFSDGSGTEVILAASEDNGLFFYRRIDRDRLVLHYTVRINNLRTVALQINGEKRAFPGDSSHLTAQMRATDIARQARAAFPQDEWARVKHIRLNIFFRSDNGGEKNIPVTMYRAPMRGGLEALQKCFENAVWWQHYLSQLAQRRSEADTLTFQDIKE